MVMKHSLSTRIARGIIKILKAMKGNQHIRIAAEEDFDSGFVSEGTSQLSSAIKNSHLADSVLEIVEKTILPKMGQELKRLWATADNEIDKTVTSQIEKLEKYNKSLHNPDTGEGRIARLQKKYDDAVSDIKLIEEKIKQRDENPSENDDDSEDVEYEELLTALNDNRELERDLKSEINKKKALYENNLKRIEKLKSSGTTAAERKEVLFKAYTEFDEFIESASAKNAINEMLIKNAYGLFKGANYGDKLDSIHELDSTLALKIKQELDGQVQESYWEFLTPSVNYAIDYLVKGGSNGLFLSKQEFLKFVNTHILNAMNRVRWSLDKEAQPMSNFRREEDDDEGNVMDDDNRAFELLDKDTTPGVNSDQTISSYGYEVENFNENSTSEGFADDVVEAIKKSGDKMFADKPGIRYVFDEFINAKVEDQSALNMKLNSDFVVPGYLFKKIWDEVTKGTTVDPESPKGLRLPGSNPLARSFLYKKGEGKIGHLFTETAFQQSLSQLVIPAIQAKMPAILSEAFGILDEKYPGIGEVADEGTAKNIFESYLKSIQRAKRGQGDKSKTDNKYRRIERGLGEYSKGIENERFNKLQKGIGNKLREVQERDYRDKRNQWGQGRKVTDPIGLDTVDNLPRGKSKKSGIDVHSVLRKVAKLLDSLNW